VSKARLKERLDGDVLLLDGAMGTQLFARGAAVGKCNDYLNVESPDIVMSIHRSYSKAGSEAVITNTFGANKYALGRHGYGDYVTEINLAAARLARQAVGEGRYVLGDIGPSGDFLEPLGGLKPQELREAFAAQAEALKTGGVDGFIIETMTALEEAEIAVQAVKLVADGLPVFASMAFDRAKDDFRTMMGVDISSAVERMVSLRVDAVGFNCGTISLEEYVELAGRYVTAVRATGRSVPVLAEPNAGRPELVEGKAVYKVTAEEFAAAAGKIVGAGITIIGGCCGTGPAHIKAVSALLSG